VILLVSLPLWPIVAIGILIFDGRPVFFRQQRIGRHGAPFTMIKFRTLREPSGPAESSGHVAGDPVAGIDARRMPFGTFLRRLRIDELPQLLLVLGGQMSLVGPRPEMLYYHYRSVGRIRRYEHRLTVKPGVTGWAQVNYGHTTTEAEYRRKTLYDLWYVDNRNFLLDLWIILLTVGVVIRRAGAR